MPGITVTHVGLPDVGGGNKQMEFSLQGTDLDELERLSQAMHREAARRSPAWSTSTPALKPDKPTIAIEVRRDAASDLGLAVAQLASTLRTLVAGKTVGNWRAPDDQNYDVNVRLAPDAPQRARRPGAAADHVAGRTPTARRASCG